MSEEILKFLEQLVKEYPNDTDLGKKLRVMYFLEKNKINNK